MTLNGWIQILLFLAAVAAVTQPFGRFMASAPGSIPCCAHSSA
jgi:hypothetical protein